MIPGGMGGMMKNLQKNLAKMQEQMAKVQAEAAERTVEATAGGGAVKVVVSGGKEVKSVTIKPEAVDPEDVEMLQDLIVAAVNEGLKKAEEMMEEAMKKVTGGLPKLPGMF